MGKKDPMTHDELLALLTATPGHSPWAHFFKKPNSVMLALRAVVELHKPCEIKDWDDEIWYYCEGCSNSAFFPWKSCSTIQAIKKELG